ncbi:S-layer family protein [cf. Phormidesmis sp. LEGE 11477]|uniref:beta strand repeat-containing protein n=1 Tax=cf. Phormidesmis sp. LEGE 11477 TaxID=1828680 RepID=UPI00187EC5AB|nr:S-layer family protein [cf. Phormidesmis sp. LEGE 11477]MBE9062655.1 S-layer family protein [cf. Phormidesmis sp. LEGE 11477]
MGLSKTRSTSLIPVSKPFVTLAAIATMLSVIAPAVAQTVDGDPTVGTLATPGTNLFTITGGTVADTNLFHSFQDFSPQSWSAIFDLDDASYADSTSSVDTIFSRVSGSSVSNIDGLLQVIGGNNPDFFLLNPNGIVFGPDAQLDIGGSFIGSTAESIRFDDGTEFTANSAVVGPLLTVSTPTGLQMGASSRGIQVNDTGYTKLKDLPLAIDSSSSLQVMPGRTISLIGSDITFGGGMVSAPGGQIEIGAVREGVVIIDPSNYALDYRNVQRFGDMQFSSQSLINASDLLFESIDTPYAFGSKAGDISLQGRHLSFQDGSVALIQNFGSQLSGSIQVNASDVIELDGSDASGELGSGFTTNSLGSGMGADVTISAQQLLLTAGASVLAETFQSAPGGNVTVTASDAVRLEPGDVDKPNSIRTNSYGSGTAGDVSISTRRLTNVNSGVSSRTTGSGSGGNVNIAAGQLNLIDGGSISSATLGSGIGGNVLVESDVIEVGGINSGFFPSTIGASSANTGDAGKLTVSTRQLLVRDGGRVDSSTIAFGNAGSVTVTASESIEVSGTVPGSINPSLIVSSANIVDPAFRAFIAGLGILVPAVPTGASGDVTIDTPLLVVKDGAQVTVRNDGPGDAGTLRASADTIDLNNNAGITASTQQGSGGNIFLNARDVLLMRDRSRISAEAGGIGDGGNLAIITPAIVALENSDIIASAFQGNGGNIDIDTQLLVGTQFRDQLTPESDITASSEFGLSGTVSVEGFESDPSSGLVELPGEVADSSNQIASSCADAAGNRFVASGRGGLPPTPERLASNRPWNDLRDLSAFGNQSLELPIEMPIQVEAPLTEATAWTIDEHGQIALIDTASRTEPTVSLVTCASTFDSASSTKE